MISKFIKPICVACSIFLRLSLNAQEYNWAVKLDSVKQDGFYKIILSPGILSKLQKDNFSDLRIVDASSNEIPYLLRQVPGSTYKQWFHPYTIVSKEVIPKRFTKLIIHNPEKNSINNFTLIVKNNDAYKTAKLSGSDDSLHWYFISSNYPLSRMYNEANVANEKRIDFPLSNYEYYALEINDSLEAPLNILQIGYHDASSDVQQLTQLPSAVMDQRDSITHKKSYVSLQFNAAYHINSIQFEVYGPKFYKRSAVLYIADTSYNGKKTFTELSTFYLSSNGFNQISFPELYGKEFLVVISNEDNEALVIKSIKAFQSTRYLISYLTHAIDYKVFAGNKKASIPSYDLTFFTDSIPFALPELKTLDIDFIGNKDVPKTIEGDWFKSKIWIWSALAFIVGLLSLFSYRMIKEMDQKKL